VKIRDLAENMIRLAGLSLRTPQSPDGDIEISVQGIRPGEKLYEELFYDESQAIRTKQPKILKAKMTRRSNLDFDGHLASLRAAVEAEDEAEVRRILFDVIERSAS
jgi:FlaA1/EpsC-like NDP-sugar epimerase